ncbi:MAG: hypothetical protein H0V93_11415 [Euzebyales bacterium]|nr:hypothetical protein [Euzebyales bacterium]
MRVVSAVLVVLLLAGCTGADDPGLPEAPATPVEPAAPGAPPRPSPTVPTAPTAPTGTGLAPRVPGCYRTVGLPPGGGVLGALLRDTRDALLTADVGCDNEQLLAARSSPEET